MNRWTLVSTFSEHSTCAHMKAGW